MLYSVVIPVYNRPDEVNELLASLMNQSYSHFEVIVVDDGSTLKCDEIAKHFSNKMSCSYYYKENSGPGQTRNYAAERANGDYLIILDSDCVLPTHYLEHINEFLTNNPVDAFGGPDKAHSSFSIIQKAINYSMTSFFTTGGIRGGKKKMDKFYPRSFNMGIKREAYKKLQGFSKMRFGEDVDFSIRIIDAGYKSSLISEAWVYHKRRSTFKQFYKQVHNSGIARINLFKLHPSSLKLVHLLPSLFTVGVLFILLLGLLYPIILLLLALYAILVFIDSSIKNRSILVGIASIFSSYIQLIGYGTGFIRSWWSRCVLKKGEFSAFKNNFYK